MKSIKLLIALLLLTQISIAQTTKNVESFDGLTVKGSIKLLLVPSSEEKIEYKIIKGDKKNLVMKNKNNILTIETKNKWYKGSDTKAEVTVYFKELNDLDISSGVSARSDGDIKAKRFDLEISGGASCYIDLISDTADIDISSGSSLTLSGSSQSADIEVSSGSSMRALDFEVEDIDIEVSSGSAAKVNATKSIKGSASSGSSLQYEGQPNSRDIDKDISSSVKEI